MNGRGNRGGGGGDRNHQAADDVSSPYYLHPSLVFVCFLVAR